MPNPIDFEPLPSGDMDFTAAVECFNQRLFEEIVSGLGVPAHLLSPPATPDALRALLSEPHDGAANADGQRRAVVRFDREGGFISEN